MTEPKKKRRSKTGPNAGEVLPPEIANALVPVDCAVTDADDPKRPKKWSEEIENEICAHIVTGKTLIKICTMPHMPAVCTVVKWLRERPIFAVAYAHAREEQADTFADMMIDIAFDGSTDWVQDPDTGQWKPNHDVVQRAKLKVDTLKWVASKLKPKTYGDRVEARMTGADGGAIQIDQRTMNINIDANVMTVEARELLRTAVLGAISPPRPTEEEDS